MAYTAAVVMVLDYIRDQYGVEPEYLWARSPNSAALRHHISKKWFAALMLEIPRKTLHLPGEGCVDVINVKGEPVINGSLRDCHHILPGYHMNKEHWITIVLDGALPLSEIAPLIDMSYAITSKSKKRCSRRDL